MMKELIRKILKEETEDFYTCLPLFKEFKIPEDGFVVTDKKYGIANIDKFFWKVVDLVDYKSDDDYDRIRELLLKLNRFCGIKPEVFKILEDSLEIKMDALDERWGDDIREVGDDSWSDLRADIIQRGRDLFMNAMNEFSQVPRLGKDKDYTLVF